MENNKWLKRKFPNSFERIKNFLDDNQFQQFKNYKFRIGILKEDLMNCQNYPKDSIFLYKMNKVYYKNRWTGDYDMYLVFKCQKGYTASGYHGFICSGVKYEEVLS